MTFRREQSAESLALLRIAFYAALFAIYFHLDIRPWAQVSSAFWMPVSVFRFLPAPPTNAALLGAIQIAWKAALLSAAAGLFTRASGIVAAALGFFVLGLPQNFGKIDHTDGLAAILLGILAISYSGDAWSLDSMRFHRVRRKRADFEYEWPVHLGRILFALVFFAAGVSKLRVSGLEWMTADNLRYLLIEHQYSHLPPTSLGPAIARSTILCSLAAIGTVAIELSTPLAVFSKRLRWPILLSLLALQTGIALTMGVYFTPYLADYAFFVPWESWWTSLRTRSRLTRPPVSGGIRTARPA